MDWRNHTFFWKPTGCSIRPWNICEWTDTTVTQLAVSSLTWLPANTTQLSPHFELPVTEFFTASTLPRCRVRCGATHSTDRPHAIKNTLPVYLQWISHSQTGGHCAQQFSLGSHLTQITEAQTYECLLGFKQNLGKMVTRCMLIGETIPITQQCRNCKLIINWKTELLQQVP